jgi:hypothetical protein
MNGKQKSQDGIINVSFIEALVQNLSEAPLSFPHEDGEPASTLQ